MGAQKAWAAALIGAVVGLLSTLSGALSTGEPIGGLDAQTWINAILAAIIGSGLGGGATYAIPNSSPDDVTEVDL